MGEIVSTAKIFIDSQLQNQQLKRVQSWDVTSDKDLTVLTAIGVEGGAGFQEQNGGGEISLEVYRESGTPEVDWYRYEREKRYFALTVQDTAGKREQFQSCRVANIGAKKDDKGTNMMTVKVKFLRRADLN